jgi:hypothetical protein
MSVYPTYLNQPTSKHATTNAPDCDQSSIILQPERAVHIVFDAWIEVRAHLSSQQSWQMEAVPPR